MTRLQFYRFVHSVTRTYPWVRGTGRITRGLGRLLPVPPGSWLTIPPTMGLPQIVVDVSVEFHRSLFLFPRVYRRLNVSETFLTVLNEQLVGGGIYVDVGAHVGVYAIIASRLLLKTGRVYAFEPDPITFDALKRTLMLNDVENVVPVEAAVSDESSTASLYRHTPGSTMNSLAGYDRSHRIRRGDSVLVRTTSLDEYCSSVPIDEAKIKLIKVDVEGAEANTIRGMLTTLDRARCPVWCEVRGISEPGRGEETFGPVSRLLYPLGYRPFRRLAEGVEEPVSSISKREDVLFRWVAGEPRH